MTEFDLNIEADPVVKTEETPVAVSATTDSGITPETVTVEDSTGAIDIDPEVRENDERLARTEEDRVANFKASTDGYTTTNRIVSADANEKRQASEAKKNDQKALNNMLKQRQEEMLSFKLDGQDVTISKKDFKKNLEKWVSEDKQKAKAALKNGDRKLYEQLMHQVNAGEQLLKDLKAGKDMTPDLVKDVLGGDPSRIGVVLGEKVSAIDVETAETRSLDDGWDEPAHIEAIYDASYTKQKLGMRAEEDSGMYNFQAETVSSRENFEQVFDESDQKTSGGLFSQPASYSKSLDGNGSSLSSRAEFNAAASGMQVSNPTEQFNQEVSVKYKAPDNTMSAMY